MTRWLLVLLLALATVSGLFPSPVRAQVGTDVAPLQFNDAAEERRQARGDRGRAGRVVAEVHRAAAAHREDAAQLPAAEYRVHHLQEGHQHRGQQSGA